MEKWWLSGVNNTIWDGITAYVCAHLNMTHALCTNKRWGAGCRRPFALCQCLQLFCDCRLYVYNLFYSVGPSIYGDTHLGRSCSLYQAPNQTESSPQVREVRRKKRVVLQRCRGLGLYMVRGSATVLFLRETHTWCWCHEWIHLTERAAPNILCASGFTALWSCLVLLRGCMFYSN